MTAHVKQSLDDLDRMMRKLNTDIGKAGALQAGDIKTLKLVMGAIKKVKDEGTDLQFTLDQLQETINYMKGQNMGKLDSMERKLGDVEASFQTACKEAPGTRKQIKPLQDAEATKVITEITEKEEQYADRHKKMIRLESSRANAARRPTRARGAVRRGQRPRTDCAPQELAALFEFPERSENIIETVKNAVGPRQGQVPVGPAVHGRSSSASGTSCSGTTPFGLEEETKA